MVKRIMDSRYALFRVAFTVAVICLLLQFFHEQVGSYVRYDRVAILQGEWWRLLSGHFIHLNWFHLVMNLAVLLVFASLVTVSTSVGYWMAWLLFLSLGVSGLLLLFSPELGWYTGLSGILHGLFLTGLSRLAYQFQGMRWPALLMAAGVLAKVGYEQYAGALPGSSELIAAPVVVDAHLFGVLTALSGLGCGRIYHNYMK